MKKLLKMVLLILFIIIIFLKLSNIHDKKPNHYWTSRLSTKYYKLK